MYPFLLLCAFDDLLHLKRSLIRHKVMLHALAFYLNLFITLLDQLAETAGWMINNLNCFLNDFSITQLLIGPFTSSTTFSFGVSYLVNCLLHVILQSWNYAIVHYCINFRFLFISVFSSIYRKTFSERFNSSKWLFSLIPVAHFIISDSLHCSRKAMMWMLKFFNQYFIVPYNRSVISFFKTNNILTIFCMNLLTNSFIK